MKGKHPEHVSAADIAERMCSDIPGAGPKLVKPLVQIFLQYVKNALDDGETVWLRGIGTFEWRTSYRSGNRKLRFRPYGDFRIGRKTMEKYGVEMDKEKTKEASDSESYLEDGAHCPLCGKDLDSGGACPEHGTEPLEKKREY